MRTEVFTMVGLWRLIIAKLFLTAGLAVGFSHFLIGEEENSGSYSVSRSPLRSTLPTNGPGNTPGPGVGSSSRLVPDILIRSPYGFVGCTGDIAHYEDPNAGPTFSELNLCTCGGAYSAIPGQPKTMDDGVHSTLTNGAPGGCSSCGSGGADSNGSSASALDPSIMAADVNRALIPNNRVNNSSFSLGIYSQFDSQLDVFPTTEGNAISFFDAVAGNVYLFVDGQDGDDSDGQFHDLRNGHSEKIELLNSSSSLVTAIEDAATAKVTHWNGFVETFELIDLNPDSPGEAIAARLTSRADLQGRALTITYKEFTTTQIAESPNQQWQIDTVSDVQGRELSFTYNSTPQGGRWAVSNVVRNDGVEATFNYSNDQLISVDMPGGLQSTYAYAQDSYVQTATISVKEAAKGSKYSNRSIIFHVTNDYMQLSQSGASQVISQPSGVHRMVSSGSGSEWMIVPVSNPAIDEMFHHMGGNVAKVRRGDGKFQSVPLWMFLAQSPSDPNFEETDFAGVYGQISNVVAGAETGTTTAQLRNGRWGGINDEAGRSKSYEYDSNGNVTSITNDVDSTFEEFAGNSKGQLLRKRFRDGSVIKKTYDSSGRLLTTETGLTVQNGDDVQTSQYAINSKEYYGSGHASAGLLKAEMDTMYNSSQPTLHRTDFEYDSQQRLTKTIGPAPATGQARPETTISYTSTGHVYQQTDPHGHTTTYTYNGMGRTTQTAYPDGSTEQTFYGTDSWNRTGQMLKTKGRNGVVTTYDYDYTGRLSETVVAAAIDANILDGNADDTIITDPNLRQVTQLTYLDGSASLKTQIKQNGIKTDYTYDYEDRVMKTKQYPSAGVTLTSTKSYLVDLLLYDEDPYGRRKYYGYRASDKTLIRTITCTVPEQSFDDFTAVWEQTRDTSPNATFIIHDAIRDDQGRLTQVIDGRGIETRFEYDGQGREVNKRQAYGTSIEARTETLYDASGRVTEVRSPRYFDSTDTNGYQKAREQWTYNGNGKVVTHIVAPGTADGATESYTYDVAGHQATHTDFASNVWSRIEDSCCDKQTASVDPLGHGTITNTDSNRRVVHTIQVSDVSTHVGSFANPTDAKTLSETTTRYDAVGRPAYQTTWLTARGSVDTANPPIAGLNSVSAADGLTIQYLYDSNLSDGVGLDNSSGVSVPKLGIGASGTTSITLANAITKLANTVANGGAGITFNTGAPGRASVTISAEDEISFSISDSAGRTVMSGKLNNHRGSGDTEENTLATWSCQLHDATTELSGYGTLLVSQSIDALGNSTKTWTDSAGRTLRSIDQLDKVTAVTYDAGGNQLTVRDPNNVGADMVYDSLGRNTQRTDTFGDVTKTDYDRAGNAVKQTDSKNKYTLISFDSRNRRKSTTDRISAPTTFTYLATGQLVSLTDAESQTTSYTFDARGSKLTEQYPDHSSGSTVGQPGYGIVTFVMDKAGRVVRKQDQAGDTCSFNYDLAGRMTSRDYRTAANSPSGTIADSDTFTFDRSGRMLTAVSGRYNNTVGYAYDPVGRKASESLTIASQTYTVGSEFNARNELVKYTYPDSSIANRAYNARGGLSELKLDGSVIDTRSYDDGGRMTSEVLGNGITETRSYRNDNLLSGISYSNTNIGNLAYSWDANKNKTAETIGGVMSGYGFTSAGTAYDDEDRLTGYQRAATSGSALLAQSWALTSVGDWSSVTTNGTAVTRTHGPTHELLTSGGQSVTSDVKGNQTVLPASLATGGSQLAFNWDYDNKLKSSDIDNNGSADVTFEYDALGRRVARTEGSTAVVYFQADQQTIADYPRGGAASTATYRYVFASYIDEPVVRKTTGSSGTVLYFHRNQQYSILALTDSSGNVSERYAYTAYGQPTFLNASATVQTSSAANNRYTYTAREWDTTLGLHHFRARWMSGLTGGFLNRDPIGYRAMDLNLSRFVFNQPLVQLDPNGLKCTTWILLTHGPRDGYRKVFDLGLDLIKPDFQQCDKVAPVCCWMGEGKRVCRQRFSDQKDPLPDNWPTFNDNVIDSTDKVGQANLRAIFMRDIPNAMKQCCHKSKNKCGCQECYTRFFCHNDAPFILEPIFNPNSPELPTSDPCGKIWTWNCSSGAWTDRNGTPKELE